MRWLALALVGVIVVGVVYLNRDDPPDLSVAFRCVGLSPGAEGALAISESAGQTAHIALASACAGDAVVLRDTGRPDALTLVLQRGGNPDVTLMVDESQIEAEPDGYFLLLRIAADAPFLSVDSI